MFVPTKECFCNMSPTDFEKYSLYLLKQQTQGLENVKIEHNVIVEKSDGSYQIDGIVSFDVMGVRYTTIVECKRYKNTISREKLHIIYDKIRAIGAQKGILISTSGFQSGAIKYASEHGIALIQITEADTIFESRGQLNVIQNSLNLYNGGIPYIGVMQESKDIGITCKYLRMNSGHLKEFLSAECAKSNTACY